MERVTGIGGVFLRAQDPAALNAWYAEHLGVSGGPAGAVVDDQVEEYEYGRFGWANDPEGNRFELWEPERPDPGSG
jgi:predicted enzyme related to lactoylglutathione lyase